MASEQLTRLGAHAVIALVRVLQHLPKRTLDALGRGLGGLLRRLGRSRRAVVQRNLALCFPSWSAAERDRVEREHFGLLGTSLLERGLLWFAPEARLRRLMHVTGDVGLADRHPGAMMWLLPHFVGLEWAAPALMLCQQRAAVNVYQTQSNPVFDAQVRRGRARFGPQRSFLASRHEGIRSTLRRMREGVGFVNAPDMDFGPRDSTFVPFFGVPACTLLAPARIAHSVPALVQPIVVTMLPRGLGVEVHFAEPIANYPSGDAEADAATFNRWLEDQVLKHPAQYFWVHKRFKTRPAGEPGVY